jgi:hypothetical protein
MTGTVLPYSPAETATAAHWLPYLATVREAACADASATVEDLDAATVEAIDKLQRRGAIPGAVAALLGEVFNVLA